MKSWFPTSGLQIRPFGLIFGANESARHAGPESDRFWAEFGQKSAERSADRPEIGRIEIGAAGWGGWRVEADPLI